ncbi:MAG: hypothetical protein ACPLYD_04695 [Anaerolineae bacterium]
MKGQQWEEKKRLLMAEVEKVVEEMIQWSEETPAPTLQQIEEKVLEIRQRVTQRIAELVIQTQEEA